MAAGAYGNQVVKRVFIAQGVIVNVVDVQPVRAAVLLADDATVIVNGEPFLAFCFPLWGLDVVFPVYSL